MEPTTLGLWWTKLGKWQAISTAITLAAFFITLYFTGGNIKNATLIAALVALFAAFAVASTAVAFVVVVVATASTASAVFAVFADIVFAVFAFIFTVFALVLVAAKKTGISKKVVGLSCAAQFILILAPMLIVILR